MKRYLIPSLAATAAVALGAGGAHAQTKFEVKIGGDAYFEAGFVDQSKDEGLRSTEMRHRLRVNIIPSAKADNGLEYGARLRLRANASDRLTDGDRAFLFAQGGFGMVRLGVTNSFNDEVWVGRPIDFQPLGISDLVVSWIGGASSGQTTINGRYAGADIPTAPGAGSTLQHSLTPQGLGTKIVYFSPRVAGLQFGASYTPRSDSSNTDVNRLKTTSTAGAASTGNYQDVVEAGLHYRNSFGDVKLLGSAAYVWGNASASSSATDRYTDLRAFQLGAQVGYAGFALGGGYVDYGKSGQNRNTAIAPFRETIRTWNAGIQYTTGPFVVGASYMTGHDGGSLTRSGKRTLDVIEVGAGYTVAPGLTVQAQYDHFKADSDKATSAATGSPDDQGNLFVVRTILAF